MKLVRLVSESSEFFRFFLNKTRRSSFCIIFKFVLISLIVASDAAATEDDDDDDDEEADEEASKSNER